MIAAYIRVSTEEQAQEGYSIEAQKNKIIQFATSKKWVVDEFYIDEGISGKDLNRPQVQRLIKDVTEKKIENVIVYRSDRLTRDLEDMLSLTRLFQKYGVQLHSLTEEIRLQTASDRFLHNVTSAVSQYEREKISENVKMGMEQLVLTGKRAGGKTPFGYTKNLEVDLEKSEIVKLIFEQYSKGVGVRTICKTLNEQGILTDNSSKWTGKPLQYILTNPFYIGKIKWSEVLVDGKHEPIIDLNLWDKVQKEYQRRKSLAPRFSTGTFPFSSVLYCGYCRNPMYIRNNPNKVYICSTTECIQIQIKEETLEKVFLNKISVMANKDYWEKKVVSSSTNNQITSKLKKIDKELNNLETKKKRWFEAFENMAIDLSTFKERIQQLNETEENLKTEKENLQKKHFHNNYLPNDLLISQLAQLGILWEEANRQEKKQIINGLINRIDLLLLPEFKNVERKGNTMKGLRKEIKHTMDIKLNY